MEVGVDRSQASQAEAVAAAEQLAAATGIDAAPYVKQVRAAGEQAFVQAITYRAGDVPPEVTALADSTPGVLLIDGELPLAPKPAGFAAPILGTVGEVTAEMVEENPTAYEAGDAAGLSGLQARYDEQLARVARHHHKHGQLQQRDALSREEAGAQGQPLKLTLDVDLQMAAERLLAGVSTASALRGDPAERRRDPGRGQRSR